MDVKPLRCSRCAHNFTADQTRSAAAGTLTHCPNCGKEGVARSDQRRVTNVVRGSFEVVEPTPGEYVEVSQSDDTTKGPRTLRAEFRFELHDLFVQQDAWGTATEFIRDGRRVRLSIPVFAGDPEGLASIPPGFGARGMRDDETGTWSWSIVSATVSVLGEVDVDLFDLRLGDVRAEAADKARAFLREAAEIARGAIRDMLDWTRVLKDQRWLGPTGVTPPLEDSSPHLFDETTGRKVPIGEERSEGWMLNPEISVDLDFLRRVLPPRLSDGRLPPPIPSVLLADALVYARGGSVGDYARAVLLAAVALEVKVKETLRTKSHPSNRALVDLVIDSPREVTLAAAQLFDSGCEAAIGRSLHTENRELYKRIVALFEHRNAFAHHGTFPTSEQARDGVAAARTASYWLDGLAADANG